MNNQITIPSPSESPTGDLEPVEWWRKPCPVTDRIFVCGDLTLATGTSWGRRSLLSVSQPRDCSKRPVPVEQPSEV